MKVYKYLLAVVLVLFLSASLFAQDNRTKDMTEEEWQNEMNRLTQVKSDLTTELNTLKTQVADLKATSEKLQSYDDCIGELYALVGATKADIDNFRNQLDALTKKIDTTMGEIVKILIIKNSGRNVQRFFV